MTSRWVTADPEDDVMAGYNLCTDRRQKACSLRYFKIDMNQFKSIWGLMLGILLLV